MIGMTCVAKPAVFLRPSQLNVSAQQLESRVGRSWQDQELRSSAECRGRSIKLECSFISQRNQLTPRHSTLSIDHLSFPRDAACAALYHWELQAASSFPGGCWPAALLPPLRTVRPSGQDVEYGRALDALVKAVPQA